MEYPKIIPLQYFECTIECFPFSNTEGLKIEFEVLYFPNHFRISNFIVYIIRNDTFREVVVLLKIFITTRMTSTDAERRF